MTPPPTTVAADALPYRPCVGVVLFHPDGRVWAGRRTKLGNTEYSGHPKLWQFPQGGIDPGEEAEHAARRELYEETGVSTVTLLGRTTERLRYDLPPEMIGVGLKGRYRGQEQDWFAYRFDGNESEIRIQPPPDGHKPEFDAWEWTSLAAMPERVVPFKRAIYEALARDFAWFAA